MSLAERFSERPQFVTSSDGLIGRRTLAELRVALSDQELAVLDSVRRLHFATTQQIERLHFGAAGSSQPAAARSTRRMLARLFELGLLDRLARPIGGRRGGSSGYVWRISPAAARLLGQPRRHRRHEPGLVHLAHVLDVAELVVRLHERARPGDVELLSVETEPDCWRPLLGGHGGRRLLKPDLRVTLGVGDQALHWFVEVDRGTEDRNRLSQKVAAYQAARRDGGEQRRAGCFPRILWVVPGGRRADVLAEVCATANRARPGLFRVAVSESAVDALVDLGGTHGTTH